MTSTISNSEPTECGRAAAMENRRSRIAMIATYVGNWPVWFPAFLRSCETNDSIDWLIYTECPQPDSCPPNVRIIDCSIKELNRRASEATGLEINKQLYSQCDLRPAYGLIFAQELVGYDWWGHCDLDVIWGDLRRFIREDVLAGCDVFSWPQGKGSPRFGGCISGHMTLWRNSELVNSSFRQFPDYEAKLTSSKHYIFDEDDTTRFIQKPGCPLKACWADSPLADYYELERNPVGWRWEQGRLLDAQGHEWPYLHFMSWKRYLKTIDFQVYDRPEAFSITRRGIWSRKLPKKEVVFKNLGYDRWFYRGLVAKRTVERIYWNVQGAHAQRRMLAQKRRHW